VSDDLTPSATAVAEPPAPADDDSSPFGTFDAEGVYHPRPIVENDLGAGLDDAYTATMVDVKDGQIVSGSVVRVDHDEVLLDIGYKSEGVIPARELSIRNDVDPGEIVKVGETLDALVLTKEDKDGRLILS
jgi:small subunit ribosomal protein S1